MVIVYMTDLYYIQFFKVPCDQSEAIRESLVMLLQEEGKKWLAGLMCDSDRFQYQDAAL